MHAHVQREYIFPKAVVTAIKENRQEMDTDKEWKKKRK